MRASRTTSARVGETDIEILPEQYTPPWRRRIAPTSA
jgi:hypothetical protein